MHLLAVIASCRDCDWEHEHYDAVTVAARHSKKHGHEVWVNATYTHCFGKHGEKKEEGDK